MKFKELLRLVKNEPVFSSGFLQAGISDSADLSRQLSRWKTEGKVLQLRRGLYTLGGDYQRFAPHRFTIANRLKYGSYISLQSSLAFHSLIPENVPVVTSVSGGRPCFVDTPVGSFQFRHLQPRLIFGYQTVDLGEGGSAFIAFPEKALLDLIHLTAGSDDLSYLKELRLQNTDMIDMKRLHEFARISGRKKWFRAADLVHQLIREEKE